MIAFHDGAWLDEREVRLPIRDPAVTSGHGVFESVRLHGGRFFRVEAHLERLAASAALLAVPHPPLASLREILLELARRSGVEEASARILLTPGAPDESPAVIATISPMPPDWRDRAARGWRIATADTRHPAPETVPPALKSLGRVYSVLARLEARAAGADDALLLLPGGIVAEGPTWNFFFRSGGVIRTAAVEAGVLPGVTRQVVLEVAASRGLQVEVGRPGSELLARADAAFATMSSLGVVPILELDGRALPASRDLAAALQDFYWSVVAAHDHATG